MSTDIQGRSMALLQTICDRCGGDIGRNVPAHEWAEIGKGLGFSGPETDSYMRWLLEMDMLTQLTTAETVALTSLGVIACEDGGTLRAPTPVVHSTQNIFHGNVGAFQTGPNAVADVVQNIGAGSLPPEIAQAFEQLRAMADAAPQRDEALELVAALEECAAEKAQGGSPKLPRAKSFAKSLQQTLAPAAMLATLLNIILHWLGL
jgi:hypothetical protein